MLLFNVFIQKYICFFTFVYNSLISVMPYKVHNERRSGTTAKTLISEIYYNVYNMIGWTPDRRKCVAVAILLA